MLGGLRIGIVTCDIIDVFADVRLYNARCAKCCVREIFDS